MVVVSPLRLICHEKGLRGSCLFLVQFIEGDGKHQQTFGTLCHISRMVGNSANLQLENSMLLVSLCVKFMCLV